MQLLQSLFVGFTSRLALLGWFLFGFLFLHVREVSCIKGLEKYLSIVLMLYYSLHS
jgi:hypothetical protein